MSIKNKDARMKIEKEVKILKNVNSHENIIKLYEVFEDSRSVYLVFELLEKGDLVNFFRENSLLEEEELKVFFKEIGIFATDCTLLTDSKWSKLHASEQRHS